MSDELLSEGAKHVAEHGATSFTSVLGTLGLLRFFGKRDEDREEKAREAEAAALEKRLSDIDAGQRKVLEQLAVLIDREKRLEDDRREVAQLRRDHEGLRSDFAALRATVEAARGSKP